jgi:hypothetical protein
LIRVHPSLAAIDAMIFSSRGVHPLTVSGFTYINPPLLLPESPHHRRLFALPEREFLQRPAK